MTPDALLARLAAEGTIPAPREAQGATSWSNGPADMYPPHEHGYDKVLVGVSGSIVFTLPGTSDEVELRAGDRLDLPAGTRHGALVGPSGVQCVEAHLPRGAIPAQAVRRGWLAAETGRARGA